MSDLDFKALELKVNQLLQLTRNLHEQNQALLAENKGWKAERARMTKQKDEAKAKVEAMITRLKALEN